ncbi:MAG: DUF3048 domain-containing protein [bacterium]
MKKYFWQIIILVVGLVVLSSLAGFFFFQNKNLADWQWQDVGKNFRETKLAPRQIDGVLVAEGRENIFPYAVMVENHFETRPQSGIGQANLVYEALAEGGITRLMAIYASGEEVKEIGPVRSARPYFLDWIKEFNALLVHHGASFEAWDNIEKFEIFNLDQWYEPKYFYLRKDKAVPHNDFTSSALIGRALKDKDAPKKSDFEPWRFKEEKEIIFDPQYTKPAETIIIKYPIYAYQVKWVYDQEKNEYLRYNAGDPHLDSEGKQITAKNIAVQRNQAEIVSEEGHLLMGTVGLDEAIVFQDGLAIKGRWEKESREARTRFYGPGGLEVKFNRGTTWVEVVKKDTAVEY